MSAQEVVTYERQVVTDVVAYQEQQRTGHLTEPQRQELQTKEAWSLMLRGRDDEGCIPIEKYPARFTFGYRFPATFAGYKVNPDEIYKNLSTFKACGLSQELVSKLVTEYARQWA